MNEVKDQYEAYPYPQRDPADEARRLITGSPSHPVEIDHFLFAGQRDWSVPLRVLVAGGGTGDGLIQLAAVMKQAGRPCEITYVDLSRASREVAEARAAMRGLDGIRFVTASLLEAPELGLFDYIDCCGVLHHLEDPRAGFAALRAALAPGGGLGFMVYAPYGRSGVYPLQQAFGVLFEGLAPQERLARAREIVADLPQGHPFRCNPNLGDHHDSEAGFYDLLLHSQDRAFDVPELVQVMGEAGWDLAGFTMPALYDLARITAAGGHLGDLERMALAEKLRGTIKTHVGYAWPRGEARALASGRRRTLVPHLSGVQPRALARAIAAGQAAKLSFGGVAAEVRLPRGAAALVAGIDGRRSLEQIAAGAGMDALAMGALWGKLEAELTGWGVLRYSAIHG